MILDIWQFVNSGSFILHTQFSSSAYIWYVNSSLMNLNIASYDPLLSLVFGVLILIFPKILNYLIAAYLILIGLSGLLG